VKQTTLKIREGFSGSRLRLPRLDNSQIATFKTLRALCHLYLFTFELSVQHHIKNVQTDCLH